jgi:hypothetical protein
LQKIRVEFELKNSIMVKFRATSSLKTWSSTVINSIIACKINNYIYTMNNNINNWTHCYAFYIYVSWFQGIN